jgi:hypothetical protein
LGYTTKEGKKIKAALHFASFTNPGFFFPLQLLSAI